MFCARVCCVIAFRRWQLVASWIRSFALFAVNSVTRAQTPSDRAALCILAASLASIVASLHASLRELSTRQTNAIIFVQPNIIRIL